MQPRSAGTKWNTFFRNNKLEAKLKPARFHIMMAARILGVGDSMDAMSSNKMEKYANRLIEILQAPDKSERLIMRAAKIVAEAANGDFDRDNIRTEGFTDNVRGLALTQPSEIANQ